MDNFEIYKNIKIERFKLSDEKNKFNVVAEFNEIDSYQNNI